MTWHHADTDVLVRHAQRGDRSALEELLRRHRPRLLRLIRCRLDPRVQARVDESDVVQETLLLASRDLDHYRPQADVPFYAWLRQIAWRQLLRVSEQHLHTIRRSVLNERPLGWDHSRWSLTRQLITASTPSKAAMDEELQQRVCDALEELPEKDREVLVLRYLERLRTREIAAILNISDAAVRMRLMQALERIRHLLGISPRSPSHETVCRQPHTPSRRR